MTVAALSTLPRLGNQPLSWDEAVTLEAARRSPAHLIGMLAHTDAPLGAYYVLMHGWVRLVGSMGFRVTAGWLRVPSAVAAIGLVGLLVVFAARWFDRRIAVLAGVLLAVHPMLTFYAQDARPYTLVTCGFLASTWALLRAVERPSGPRIGLYVALAVATLYLQLFSALAFTAHLLIVRRAAGRRRLWFAVGAGIALATLPLVAVASTQGGEIGWVPKPSPSVVLSVVSHMFGGAVLAPSIAILAIVALVARPRLRGSDWLAWWVLAPVTVLVAMDFVVPDLVARYGAVCVPGAVLLAAAGTLRLPARGQLAIALTLIGAAAATTVVQQLAPYKYEDFRAATDRMGDLARPGADVMFLPASTRAGFEPYRSMEADVNRVHDVAEVPGGTPSATTQIAGEVRPAADLPALFSSAHTIFLMGDSLAQTRVLHDSVARAEESVLRSYRVVRSVRYGDIWLTEFTATRQQQRVAAGSGTRTSVRSLPQQTPPSSAVPAKVSLSARTV